MNDFEQYLQLYAVDPIILSVVAQVRYLTIWNAKKGNSITSENAQKIKQALLNLTGVAYTGSFSFLSTTVISYQPFVSKKCSDLFPSSKRGVVCFSITA